MSAKFLGQNSLSEGMNLCSKMVEARIDKVLDDKSAAPQLIAAMRYSTLGAGKKIRPFLLLSIAEILGADISLCLDYAAAIELVHAYSLIHDDLPAMDDDDFRRGKPSCHKRFDEATAILAGDALLTLAFELLSSPNINLEAKQQIEIIGLVARNSGMCGMVGGQMLDLEIMKNPINCESLQILQIHRLKTGKMFIAAAECGAILGKSNHQQKQSVIDFADNFGMAFQLQDDLDDFVADRQKKTEEKKEKKEGEKKSQTLNLAALIGHDETLKMLDELKNKAESSLKIFGSKAEILCELLRI